VFVCARAEREWGSKESFIRHCSPMTGVQTPIWLMLTCEFRTRRTIRRKICAMDAGHSFAPKNAVTLGS
jgi:hypothetical protein